MKENELDKIFKNKLSEDRHYDIPDDYVQDLNSRLKARGRRSRKWMITILCIVLVGSCAGFYILINDDTKTATGENEISGNLQEKLTNDHHNSLKKNTVEDVVSNQNTSDSVQLPDRNSNKPSGMEFDPKSNQTNTSAKNKFGDGGRGLGHEKFNDSFSENVQDRKITGSKNKTTTDSFPNTTNTSDGTSTNSDNPTDYVNNDSSSSVDVNESITSSDQISLNNKTVESKLNTDSTIQTKDNLSANSNTSGKPVDKQENVSTTDNTTDNSDNNDNTTVDSTTNDQSEVLSNNGIDATKTTDSTVAIDSTLVESNSIDTTLNETDTTTTEPEIEIDPDPKPKKFFIDLHAFGGINYASAKLTGATSEEVDPFNSNKKNLLNGHFGAGINFNYNNWFAGTGMDLYSYSDQVSYNTETYTPWSYDSTYSYITYSYVYDTSGQVIIDSIPVQNTDTIVVSGVDTSMTSSDITNTYRIIAIPLSFGYTFTIGTWALKPRLSAIFEFRRKAFTGSYPVYNGTTTVGQQLPGSQFGLSVGMELQVQKNFSNFYVYLRPGYRFRFSPLATDGTYILKQSAIQGLFGVGYTF